MRLGWVEIGQRAEFAFEAVQGCGVASVQQLQCNRHAAFAVEDFVHDAESTLPESSADLKPCRPREILSRGLISGRFCRRLRITRRGFGDVQQ